MSVTKEGGGRLNAFPTEPQIEVISEASSSNNASRLFVAISSIVIIGLIVFTLTNR